MRSILFFDEHDATTTLRVGGEASGSGAITHVDASLSAAEDAWHTPNAFIYSSFAHSGSLPMPEVRGSLLWWLDQRPRPRGGASGYLLHLLAVGDGESAAEARAGDARLLSIDVPIYPTAGRGDVGGEQLLTCGLTRLAKAEHCVAATWLSSSLVAGFLRVTVQRAQERLILVPEGHIITFANPLRLPGGVVAEDEDQLSACVVGALPPRRENSAEDLASVVVITNGQHLWRALLHLDGRTRVELIREDGEVKERVGAAVDTLRRQPHPPGYAMLAGVEAGGDHPQQREASASYTAPTSSFGGRWLSRVLGRRGEGGSGTSGDGAGHHIPARRYLSLCAVHNSHYVVLLRWNGLLEVYDGTGESWMEATSYPSCPLPQNILAGLATSAEEGADGVEAAPTIQQWAAMDERRHDLHIVSCIGRGEGRRCTWAVMPLLAASTEQRVGLRHVLDLAPPTLASSPMSCSIAHSGKSLLLLWDLGMEEDAHLLCPHTLASLNAPIPLALAQVVTVRQTTQEAEVRWEHTQTNLSRGGRYSYLRAALTHEDHFVVVERHKDYHRAHALVCSATPDTAAITTTLDALTTTVLLLDEVSAAEPNLAVLGLAGGAGEVQSGGASPPCVVDAAAPVRTQHNQHLPALAWVPTVDGEARQRRHDTPALRPFWEGLEVLRACPSGTSLIAELVEQVMQHAAPLGQLPALPRILCEARLSGWSPEFTTASAADVELAMMLAIRTECATLPPFCRFDRHAILHLVCRELHHRILFLLITYLGWMSGAAAHINDGATQDLGRLIERWVAAYHTARVCGPDLVNALAANPSDEHLVGSIVGALVEMHPHHSDDEEEASPRTTTTACTRHALGVAQRLWVSGSPRNAKAAVMWATYLANTNPLLHHYILLSDLHAGRTARAAAVHVRALHVSLELAKLSPREAVEVLLSDGILLTEAGAGQQPSTMGLVPRSEWELLLMQDANMASAVYLVGLFRYLLRRSGDVLMDGNTARRFLMVELTQLRTKVDGIHKRGGGAPSLATLQHALLELHVEALLGLARYSAEDGDVGPCFHDLQSAVALMDEARSTNHPITANLGRYTEAIQLTVRALVERSFQMPSLTNALVHLSCDIAAINSMLVHQWHQCIAALPTKSASERTEAIRTRAILGLHRFLLARHAYAQCGRVLTNLASLLRCSPRRQGDASRYLSVAELCSMAVSAVELITPAAAVRTQDDGSSAGASPTTTNASPNSAVGFSWMDLHNNTGAGSGASSLCGAEANNTSSTSRRLLSREDLPWLRLRAYQAHCEERLWSLGGTLDCADIWIEGASADNYARGITKLIHALVGVRLWQEAFELAQLAAVDVGAVAEAWAVWLVEQRRGSGSTATTIRGPHPGAEKDDDGEGDDEKDDSMEWEMLLDLCRDACGAPGDARRFDVLRRVAVAACVRDFANTPQTVMESVYEMDPYTAIAALLHAFEVLLHRRHPHAGRHDDDEEAALLRDNDVLVATPSCWLVWAAAAGLAVRALTAKQQSALTAGLVDPLARYGHEALRRDDASRISAKDQAIIDSAAHNLLKAISSISA